MEQKPQSHDTQTDSPEQGEGHFLLNIGKTVLLAAVLVAAWFVLEWLMGGK